MNKQQQGEWTEGDPVFVFMLSLAFSGYLIAQKKERDQSVYGEQMKVDTKTLK